MQCEKTVAVTTNNLWQELKKLLCESYDSVAVKVSILYVFYGFYHVFAAFSVTANNND